MVKLQGLLTTNAEAVARWLWVPGLFALGCTINMQQPKPTPANGSTTASNTATPKPQPKPESHEAVSHEAVAADSSACGSYQLEEDDSVFDFVSDRVYTWEPGSTLHVQFLDGQEANMQKVASVATEWTKHANIKMQFYRPTDTVPPGPRLKVSFQNSGYWSLIGSQAANRRGNRPTMNFNYQLFSKGNREIRRVVLHEFGHALGLWHEHQNPNANFTWNKAVIYEYYRRTHGWDANKVNRNVLRKLDRTQVKGTKFDAKSIMAYSFPPSFTVERVRLGRNYELSATDKIEIGRLYPGRTSPTNPDRPPVQPDMGAISKQISFNYALESQNTGNTYNYGIWVIAPQSVLNQIDHVLYQRQHQTFREYANGTFYRGGNRRYNFGFAWRAWGWAHIRAKVVFKNGQISEHWHRSPPSRVQRGPNWARLKASVRLRFVRTNKVKGWGMYRVELKAPQAAPHIHWIEYQRQHSSFPEYKHNNQYYIRRTARGSNFALIWKGYQWAPISVRIHFKDGTTITRRINHAPGVVRSVQ